MCIDSSSVYKTFIKAGEESYTTCLKRSETLNISENFGPFRTKFGIAGEYE